MAIALDPKHLHHAYLIEGERASALPELKKFLFDAKLTKESSPDYHLFEFDVFLIEHAHDITSEQSMRGVEGNKKIFILAFNTMTSEAQNALLKTIEEPTEDTHFFFITRTKETLIPTLRSRMQIVSIESEYNKKELKAGEEFLKASLPERFALIEPLTKAKKDDKSEAKEEARIFLVSLEKALYVHLSRAALDRPHLEVVRAVEDVIAASKYLSDRAPSLKLLLEHLALSVPQLNK